MSFEGVSLLTLQDEIAGALEADTYFSDIPVITENRGDIPTLIEEATNKAGLCVVVETPSANQRNGNIPNPYLDEINVAVTIWEHVELNRRASGTQKKFLDVAQIAAALLLQFVPTSCAPLAPVNPLFNNVPDPIFAGLQLRYRTGGGYRYTA